MYRRSYASRSDPEEPAAPSGSPTSLTGSSRPAHPVYAPARVRACRVPLPRAPAPEAAVIAQRTRRARTHEDSFHSRDAVDPSRANDTASLRRPPRALFVLVRVRTALACGVCPPTPHRPIRSNRARMSIGPSDRANAVELQAPWLSNFQARLADTHLAVAVVTPAPRRTLWSPSADVAARGGCDAPRGRNVRRDDVRPLSNGHRSIDAARHEQLSLYDEVANVPETIDATWGVAPIRGEPDRATPAPDRSIVVCQRTHSIRVADHRLDVRNAWNAARPPNTGAVATSIGHRIGSEDARVGSAPCPHGPVVAHGDGTEIVREDIPHAVDRRHPCNQGGRHIFDGSELAVVIQSTAQNATRADHRALMGSRDGELLDSGTPRRSRRLARNASPLLNEDVRWPSHASRAARTSRQHVPEDDDAQRVTTTSTVHGNCWIPPTGHPETPTRPPGPRLP